MLPSLIVDSFESGMLQGFEMLISSTLQICKAFPFIPFIIFVSSIMKFVFKKRRY